MHEKSCLLIGAPVEAGAGRRACGMGPSAYAAAGLAEALEGLGFAVEHHELVDPTLSSERLLFRLFHERGVMVFDGQAMQDACRCSQERIEAMLRSFSVDERRDMVGPDGRSGVTCEFCGVHRDFEPADFDPV